MLRPSLTQKIVVLGCFGTIVVCSLEDIEYLRLLNFDILIGLPTVLVTNNDTREESKNNLLINFNIPNNEPSFN